MRQIQFLSISLFIFFTVLATVPLIAKAAEPIGGVDRLYHGKYRLFNGRDGELLIVEDKSGVQRKVSLRGANRLTSAAEAADDQIIVVAKDGTLGQINLRNGEITSQMKVPRSKSNFVVSRSPTGRLVLLGVVRRPSLISLNMYLYFLNESPSGLVLGESFNFNDLTKADGYHYYNGPFEVSFFQNGNMALFNKGNKEAKVLVVFDSNNNSVRTKVISGYPHHTNSSYGIYRGELFTDAFEEKFPSLVRVGSDLLGYVSDNLSIHTIDQNGNLKVFKSNLLQQLVTNIESTDLGENNSKVEKIELSKNSNSNCLSVYAGQIPSADHNKLHAGEVGIMGVASILGGPATFLFSLGVIAHKTAKSKHPKSNSPMDKESLLVAMNILNDAEKDKASLEIQVMTEILNGFDPIRFRDTTDVMRAIREINSNKKACMDGGRVSLSTPKGLMYQLILQ